MVVVPLLIPVTIPSLSTVAIFGLLLVQVKGMAEGLLSVGKFLKERMALVCASTKTDSSMLIVTIGVGGVIVEVASVVGPLSCKIM